MCLCFEAGCMLNLRLENLCNQFSPKSEDLTIVAGPID